MKPIATIERTGSLTALAHPLRVRVLENLREPASAAGVARVLGVPRQKVNFHLKQLEQARLVRKVGERRTGGFVEDLYQAVARAFVVSPRVTWSKPHGAALRTQIPLKALVTLGEGLQRDAATLLNEAAFDGRIVPSVSVDTEIRFASEAERAGFMKDYFAALAPLLERYGAATGERYRLIMAAYPDPCEREDT